MDEYFVQAATRRGGYLFRSDLLDLGLSDNGIRSAMREGLLVRIRHGTYAPSEPWRGLTPEEQHLLRANSIVDKLGPGVALSHHTAVLAHGGTLWGVDLGRVHLTRLVSRAGRNEAGVVFHHARTDLDQDLTSIDGRPVTVPARAVLESCSLTRIEPAMVAASFGIRAGLCTREELAELAQQHRGWPGMLNVRLAARYAAPECESVGEVRSMHLFRTHDVPLPECQVEVRIGGRLVARCDFGWWTWRHVGEFDGRIKYGRLNADPDHPEQSLVQEKLREDRVRSHPLGMTRWMWDDLAPSARASTASRLRADLERSRSLYGRTVIDLGRRPWVA
ncbi:MAG: type IV toxin-antitoxin system AbiEi family antitoxin domain-containing protein [Aeromicrobium erythreum]